MQAGALAGARVAKAIEADKDTRRAIGGLGDVALGLESTVFDLSGDAPKTPEKNELRTSLVVDGEDFSIGDLLGSGTASTTGKNFVAEALKKIRETRMEVQTLLGLDLEDAAQNPAFDQHWKAVLDQLDKIFGTDKGDTYTGAYRVDADNDDTPDRAVGQRNPGEDDIDEDIGGIIDALSSADAFAAATAKDGKGVFKKAELTASNAADAYGHPMSSAGASMGVTGSTRYGTVRKTETAKAVTKLKYAPAVADDPNKDGDQSVARIGQQGAFSYSTLQETLRTRHIVSTGNAYYTAGTHAISGDG